MPRFSWPFRDPPFEDRFDAKWEARDVGRYGAVSQSSQDLSKVDGVDAQGFGFFKDRVESLRLVEYIQQGLNFLAR